MELAVVQVNRPSRSREGDCQFGSAAPSTFSTHCG